MSALLGWYLAVSFTAGALCALVGYIRNTIRRKASR